MSNSSTKPYARVLVPDEHIPSKTARAAWNLYRYCFYTDKNISSALQIELLLVQNILKGIKSMEVLPAFKL